MMKTKTKLKLKNFSKTKTKTKTKKISQNENHTVTESSIFFNRTVNFCHCICYSHLHETAKWRLKIFKYSEVTDFLAWPPSDFCVFKNVCIVNRTFNIIYKEEMGIKLMLVQYCSCKMLDWKRSQKEWKSLAPKPWSSSILIFSLFLLFMDKLPSFVLFKITVIYKTNIFQHVKTARWS